MSMGTKGDKFSGSPDSKSTPATVAQDAPSPREIEPSKEPASKKGPKQKKEINNTPVKLKTSELFSFPGWESTLLSQITADLYPTIYHYRIFARPTLKQEYEHKSQIGSEGITEGKLKYPYALVQDEQGRIIVADRNNGRIQIFHRDGTFISIFGRIIGDPADLTLDKDGNLVVLFEAQNRVQVLDLRVEQSPTESCTIKFEFGEGGSGPGQMSGPLGLTLDPEGNYIISDTRQHRVQVFNPQGKFIRKFGSSGQAPGELSYPVGLAVDGDNNVLVADKNNHRVQMFDPQGTVLRCFGSKGEGDGQLNFPWGLSIDSNGSVVVSDNQAGRLQIFSREGDFLQKLGSAGFSAGKFDYPRGLFVDEKGNILVADNHRIQIFG